jgi:hypothetical protein|tara:strand:+ start:384 stop:521 length:138 start_codon:yes stop_codon:yes gene_type:complete
MIGIAIGIFTAGTIGAAVIFMLQFKDSAGKTFKDSAGKNFLTRSR